MSAKLEEQIEILKLEVTQLKTSLAIHEASFEQEKVKLSDYMEKEFATHKLVMQEIGEGAKVQKLNLQHKGWIYKRCMKQL